MTTNTTHKTKSDLTHTDQSSKKISIKTKIAKHSVALLLAGLVTWWIPGWWCGREAHLYFDDDLKLQEIMAQNVSDWVAKGVGETDFNTGDPRFNSEWLFVTYQMAGIGLLQFVQTHPEHRDRYLPVVKLCIEQLLLPSSYTFDSLAWQEDPLKALKNSYEQPQVKNPNGHAAFLGYLNLLLGLYTEVAKDPTYKELNARITEDLVKKFNASPIALIETYPGEIYPVDNMAGIASIAQFDRIYKTTTYAIFLQNWIKRCKADYIDPESGLLFQAVEGHLGRPIDKPRTSGTALGAYFMSFTDKTFAKELYQSLKNCCGHTIAGFGAVDEYPPNVEAKGGDIDSGPVLFGLSFSGTGFAIASAKIHKDKEFFTALYGTAYLVGAPFDNSQGRYFVTGGPLGNAIMFAMLTAH